MNSLVNSEDAFFKIEFSKDVLILTKTWVQNILPSPLFQLIVSGKPEHRGNYYIPESSCGSAPKPPVRPEPHWTANKTRHSTSLADSWFPTIWPPWPAHQGCLQTPHWQLVHTTSSLWAPRTGFRSKHFIPRYLHNTHSRYFIYCQLSTANTSVSKHLSKHQFTSWNIPFYYLLHLFTICAYGISMYTYRVCILEHILLLFTTYAYLSAAVVLKHSLYISCRLWIQQLGLHLLSSFMGQCQFKITSHKQTYLLAIANSTVDRNEVLFKAHSLICT